MKQHTRKELRNAFDKAMIIIIGFIMGLALIFVLTLFSACKTNKDVIQNRNIINDSTAISQNHILDFVSDSVMNNIEFSFDSLNIDIIKPVEYADKPEIIRLKATAGRIIDKKKSNHNQLQNYNRIDSIAYKNSKVERTEEHKTDIRAYNPPSGTVLIISIILIIIISIFFINFDNKSK